jgi:hypothetical protein
LFLKQFFRNLNLLVKYVVFKGEDVEDNLAKLEQRLMNDEENFMRKIVKTNEFMEKQSFRELEKPMTADSLPIIKDQSADKIELVDSSTFIFIEVDKR